MPDYCRHPIQYINCLSTSLSSVVLLTSNTLPLCFIGLGIHIYTLPPKAYDLQLLAPSVVYLKNEIAFSGISLYTLLSPSSLRTCPERCICMRRAGMKRLARAKTTDARRARAWPCTGASDPANTGDGRVSLARCSCWRCYLGRAVSINSGRRQGALRIDLGVGLFCVRLGEGADTMAGGRRPGASPSGACLHVLQA